MQTRSVGFGVDRVREVLLEVVGSFGVAGTDTEFLSTQLLEVSGLGVDKEFIDGRDTDIIDQAQVHSHAYFAEVVHGLFAADLFSGLENPQRAANSIIEVIPFLVDQELSGFSFVIDQSRDDFADPLHQGFFALSQRHLIADLIEVSHKLGAFAEEPSHGYVDFVEGSKNFVDLFGGDECRQVEHDTHTETSTDVGRACSQITKFFGECIGEFAFEQVVQFIHSFPCSG